MEYSMNLILLIQLSLISIFLTFSWYNKLHICHININYFIKFKYNDNFSINPLALAMKFFFISYAM